MLNTLVTIILIPFALGSLVVTGAIIGGVITYLKRKK